MWEFEVSSQYAAGVAVDEKFVYAYGDKEDVVTLLNKMTGRAIRQLKLSSSPFFQNVDFTYGTMAVALGKLFIANSNSRAGRVYRYDLETGNYDGVEFGFGSGSRIYRMVFDGQNICISATTSSTSFSCYEVLDSSMYQYRGYSVLDEFPTLFKQSEILTEDMNRQLRCPTS